ncbi:Alpha/Beta hydrolase protein [Aspergillus unguis]
MSNMSNMSNMTATQRNEARRAAAGIERLSDIQIPLSDGTNLLADVYRPADNATHPVIIRLGVYGRAFDVGAITDEDSRLASEEREDAWFRRSSPKVAPPDFYENMVSANVSDWVPRGYVCVRVDARGVGRVPGVIDPFSVQEARDYYEVIEWAAKQSWSNGSVGLYGGSYNAGTAWNVAALAPPSLRAIIPFAGDIDIYREVTHPGGLAMVGFLETWLEGNVKAVQGGQCETVDMLDRIKQHPFADPEHYGPDGDTICVPDLSKVTVPFLTSVCLGAPVHGRGGAEAFLAAVNAPAKELLVVDANYWPFMYEDCLQQQFDFFDRHLKDIPTTSYPPVRFIMRSGRGEYEWKEDTQWPLSHTKYLDFYLDASQKALSLNTPIKPGVSIYSAEAPTNQTASPHAIFESPPLTDDINLAGPISTILWVSSSSTDMDIYAVLRVLDPEGKEISYAVRPLMQGCPLSHGCLKVSHRATDPQRSTPWRPFHTHREKDYAPLKPGEICSVHVEMTLATARVRRGSRFQLLIEPFSGESSSTWKAYGGIASPGNQAGDNGESVGGRAYDIAYHKGAENRIHTGGVHLSRLLIPSVR